MKTTLFLFVTFALASACSTLEPALSVENPISLEKLAVKGRQGFLINQKLYFGEYETSRVKRSWTKGGNTRIPLSTMTPIDVLYPDLISLNYADRHQSFYFQLQDSQGNFSDVYATSEFRSEDLQVGSHQNTAVNILEDVFGSSDFQEDLFYLQLFINEDSRPWQMVLDNQAAQVQAKTYRGVIAYDKDLYYSLHPITQVATPKGPRNILMGSVGYEIRNNRNEMVAAVSLIDGGFVYFNTKNTKERFLLANLSAALLLQQNVAETI